MWRKSAGNENALFRQSTHSATCEGLSFEISRRWLEWLPLYSLIKWNQCFRSFRQVLNIRNENSSHAAHLGRTRILLQRCCLPNRKQKFAKLHVASYLVQISIKASVRCSEYNEFFQWFYEELPGLVREIEVHHFLGSVRSNEHLIFVSIDDVEILHQDKERHYGNQPRNANGQEESLSITKFTNLWMNIQWKKCRLEWLSFPRNIQCTAVFRGFLQGQERTGSEDEFPSKRQHHEVLIKIFTPMTHLNKHILLDDNQWVHIYVFGNFCVECFATIGIIITCARSATNLVLVLSCKKK